MKAQQTTADLTQKLNHANQKLEYANNEVLEANNELQQYRLRAKHQLQLKERLIEQLQSGKEISQSEDNDKSTYEIDQLSEQRDQLQLELSLLTRRFDDSKNFIEKMEHKHRMMTAEAEDKMLALNETINQLNLGTFKYEDEIRFLKKEIEQVREEMLKEKTSATTKLHEK